VADVELDAFDQGLQELQRQFARDALRVIYAETTDELDNISSGTWKEAQLPWTRGGADTVAALLKRLYIVKTSGTATTFDVEIRTEQGGTGVSVVYSATGQTPPHDQVWATPVDYLSTEAALADRSKVVIAIKANGGDGSFSVRLYGRPLR
jgi:hypothetical protein